MKYLIQIILILPLLFTMTQAKDKLDLKEKLGRVLYFDKSLSQNKKMSCATCHHPKKAFIDIRKSKIGHMAAFSADRKRIGDRNVPTASYAAFIPDFHTKIENGETVYIGGQFLDGRAIDLKEQAKGPFLNPVEMQMPNKQAVMNRVFHKKKYRRVFKKLYGETIFSDVDKSYDALADAIASFEKTKIFSPFNSRYDRFIKGKGSLSRQELHGLRLFSDTARANCVACHPLIPEKGMKHTLFTDFSYDNLGIPKNKKLRYFNGMGSNFIDHGLLNNPAVNDISLDGAFRVNTLRNIAVTAPYMHNGIFKNLKTVVHFYNTRDVDGAINPETQHIWQEAEVPATVNHNELGDLGLSDREEDAIVAFLQTLTDKRYDQKR